MKPPRALTTWFLRYLWPLAPGYPDEGRRIIQGPLLKELLARAAQQSGGLSNVLNAGSGEGGYSPMLLQLPGVQRVVETDFGFRTNVPPRLDSRQVFFCSSLTDLPLPARSFDLILCSEVLEHIAEHEQALDEMTRVAVDGAWLLITVPTPPAPPDSAHVREGYRPSELGEMLRERGFEVIETKFCMRFFFRFLLAHWWRVPLFCPRMIIRGLAALDRWVPLGPPMDLMILAHLSGRPAGNGNAEQESQLAGASHGTASL